MPFAHLVMGPETALAKSTYIYLYIHSNECLLIYDYSLALVEMRIILAMVIWNFDLKLDDSCRDWMDQLKGFTIYQKGPVGVYMIPRKDVSHS